MAHNFYGVIALTGGGVGALDAIDGASLNDKDGALVITETSVYHYFLDDDSGAAEDSPDVIKPDNNAGTKRWILKNVAGGTIQDSYQVDDYAVGVDLTAVPVFCCSSALTLQTIGILTEDAPAGVDDANTVVITLKDEAGNTIVSKTFNTATQPPSSDYVDLGALSNASLNAFEHVTLTTVLGATANMPAFKIIFKGSLVS